MLIAEYLFKHRKEINMTQLAKKLDVQTGYLSRVTNGKCIPSIYLAKKIEEVTNGEVSWSEIIDYCLAEKEKANG